MSLEIRELNVLDGIDIFEMLQELPADENGFMNPMKGKSYDEYKEWLKRAKHNSEQVGMIDGWKVPETTFWFFEDGKPVGYGKIRHFLTDKLLKEGGNIGYSICPSARNKGLGKKFVENLIIESKKIGVNRLLFTIKNDNLASIKAALSNGGVIERKSDERHYIYIDL